MKQGLHQRFQEAKGFIGAGQLFGIYFGLGDAGLGIQATSSSYNGDLKEMMIQAGAAVAAGSAYFFRTMERFGERELNGLENQVDALSSAQL